LFVGPELDVWQFFQDYVKEYAETPSEALLLEKGLQDIPTPDPLKYYVDLLIDRYTHKKLGLLTHEVKNSLNTQDLSAAQSLVKEAMSSLTMLEVQNDLMEMSEESATYYWEQWGMKNKGISGIETGWPSLDEQTGGLRSGDVVSIVGRPGSGKSWCMLHSALHVWRTQKKKVLFISMEMPKEAINSRVIAMYAKLNAKQVKDCQLDAHEQDILEKAHVRMGLEKGDFWVLDANLSGTVLGLSLMVSHLKPDVVFIDGAYLLRSDNPKLGRYDRVADNVEQLKHMAHNAGIPCFTSWQFNREAARKLGKKKVEEAVGLEDIAYSDAIGQISSVVLGLFHDDADDVEVLHHRKVSVLKGRDGQVGSFNIQWLFETHTIGFGEVDSEEDLEMAEAL
jgi:replicative DNA helicase